MRFITIQLFTRWNQVNVRARHRKNWKSWKCWDVLIYVYSLHPSVWMQYSQRSTHSLVLGSLKECCSTLGPQCLNGWPGVCPWFTTLRKEVPCRWTQWLHLHTRGNVPASLSPERASICGEILWIIPCSSSMYGEFADMFTTFWRLHTEESFEASVLSCLSIMKYAYCTCTVSLWWFECPCRLCCLSVTITKPLAWMAVLSFEQPSKFGWSACFHPTWKYGMGILFHMSVPACRCSRSQATCRPNPARKGGMMQHVPFFGLKRHICKAIRLQLVWCFHDYETEFWSRDLSRYSIWP